MAKKLAQSHRRTALVITGTRAEFGLLRPVMDAIKANPKLRLRVLATGTHLLPPARTIKEVEAAYDDVIRVPMQRAGASSRLNDARALGRGIEGIARVLESVKPDWVVVLGDRIEALAGASAASIAGIAVCHLHGGDRAEGIADEAMRHAITKLSHVHCAATEQSRQRIIKLGERPDHVFNTGSPAIDGLDKIKPMSDAEAKKLGDPQVVMLLHPSGLPEKHERAIARGILGEMMWMGFRTLALYPNHDPGHEVIREEIDEAVAYGPYILPVHPSLKRTRAEQEKLIKSSVHLPREKLLSLLKRLATRHEAATRGFLVGNSSAALIEGAALGIPAVNVGPRQSGREHGENVIDCPYLVDPQWAVGPLEDRLGQAAFRKQPSRSHPYGNGRAGVKIAALLAKLDPHDAQLIRKRNTY